MTRLFAVAIGVAVAVTFAAVADAAEIKVLTAGAMKSTVLAIQPEFEKATGHKLVVDNDTTGGLIKRIEGGEAFDFTIITPAAIDGLAKKSLVTSGTPIARVGVG